MPEGLRLEPVVPGSGASSARIKSGRGTNVAAGNIGAQTQAVGGIQITPENTEAIREALKNAPIDILQKALRDADVQITERTLDIVKSLINGSLPLTEQNIVDLLLQSHVFKDAPPDILALMMRLEIPATAENVEQFENLINKGAQLSEQLENLINKLPAEIFKGAKNLAELSFVFNEIAKILAGEPEQQQNNAQRRPSQNPAGGARNTTAGPEGQQVQQNNAQRQPSQNPAGGARNTTAGSEGQQVQQNAQPPQNNKGAGPVLTRYELNNLLNLLKGLGAPNQVLNKIINANRHNAEISGNKITDNQASRPGIGAEPENALEVINKFVQDTAAKLSQRPQAHGSELGRSFFESMKNMLESAAVKKFIHAGLQEKWVLTSQDLNGGSTELSRYYNGINNNLHKFEQLLNILNSGADSESLQAQAKNVRDNLSLMNEISKTMPFLQIPLRFSNDRIINSDIYIFNNRKKINRSPVKNIHALIKLELESLGGVNIYLNMAGKNVRARFLPDKSEAVPEITKNLPELDKEIHSLGFNFKSAAVPPEKEQGFDILDDFINREIPRTEIRKYILRKRI